MSDTLKDQLLALGFKPPPKPPAVAARAATSSSSATPRDAAQRDQRLAKAAGQREPRPARPPGPREPDLAQAWAARARDERDQREHARREAEELARAKRERKQQLQSLLEGKAVNDATAELARHFPQGGKIRRVYVTAAQLALLNRGELGVVQHLGRYAVVERAVALAAAGIAADCLVLLPDPDAQADDGVPADLVW
jgi:uncharacterized protein YaiL (DUF2058 family)